MLYENPHSTSSLKLFKPKNVSPPDKRGAPVGHKGATRVLLTDEIIQVSAVTSWDHPF